MWETYLEARFRSEMPRTHVGYRLVDGGVGSVADQAPAADLTFELDVTVGDCEMPLGREAGGGATTPPALGEAYRAFAQQGFPAATYLDAMEAAGIDYMVLYPTVGLYTCHAPTLSATTAAAYRRAANNWLADFCSEGKTRLIGVGGLDLRDPDEAAKEATRCVDALGFKAVFVNPAPVGAHRMFEAEYDRLWATIADLGVPLGLHAAANNACDPMLVDYLGGLRTAQVITAFSVGNMIASAGLIMGGVLDRHPGLRVVHLESGAGWVAFWLDRMRAGLLGSQRQLEQPGLRMHPVDYFQRQCFVAADPDDSGIKGMIEFLGDNNLVLGTDFGHLEGNQFARAVDQVSGLEGVTDESKRKMLWDNALRLYPIEVPS